MTSLIKVASVRLIQQDILAEVVIIHPKVVLWISDVDTPYGQVICRYRVAFTNGPNVARHTEDFTFAFPRCGHISRRLVCFNSGSLTT